ncbi:G-protein coupled receptor 182-like [Heterodontus francisci]|uniref:G-protein coupled receptor 182-like n=1 Tax=Heterodontus francisci TaxID=7792 RepID=UPI00355C2CA7
MTGLDKVDKEKLVPLAYGTRSGHRLKVLGKRCMGDVRMNFIYTPSGDDLELTADEACGNCNGCRRQFTIIFSKESATHSQKPEVGALDFAMDLQFVRVGCLPNGEEYFPTHPKLCRDDFLLYELQVYFVKNTSIQHSVQRRDNDFLSATQNTLSSRLWLAHYRRSKLLLLVAVLLKRLQECLLNKNRKCWKYSAGQAASVERETELAFWVGDLSSELEKHEGTDCFTQKMIETFHTITKVFYTVLAVVGVIGFHPCYSIKMVLIKDCDNVNLVAILILTQEACGLSTCTTRYLVAMAMADLLVIITDVILTRMSYYYFPGSFLDITPLCSVIFVLSHASTDCSVWFTVTFSFDRFIAICCRKLKTQYCTEKTAVMVLATICILLSLKNVPFYFIIEPGEIINNVSWFCDVKPSYFTQPEWVGFDWFDTILNPLLPFALILLLNALTVRHILVASRVRKVLRSQSKGDNGSDPEMESRKKSVILLFTISGSFILLWLTYVIEFFYYNIAETNPTDYNESLYIFAYVGAMLQNLSCCTNTFIYGVTQSKFREQFKRAMKYVFTLIVK